MDKILICSLGSIGKRYKKIIKAKWPEVEIGVLRSRDKSIYTRRDLVDECTKYFYSIKDAIAWSPDGAIVCSPANMHLEQANALLSVKIPALIEKPLITGEEKESEIERLIELKNKTAVEVGYVYRHHPLVKELKNILERKEIGLIVDADFYCGSWLKEWRDNVNYKESVSARKELGGGALLELSHEIDMAHYLFGKLSLKGANIINTGLLQTNAEDMATLLLTNSQNVSICIRVNYCSKPSKRHVNIRGELGEIIWDLIEQKLTVVKSDGDRIEYSQILQRDELFEKQLLHFFEIIEEQKRPKCSIGEALQVVRCIQKARNLK